MKVEFQNLISGFTGKADNSVVYYNKAVGRYLVRRMPEKVMRPQNTEMQSASRNIWNLSPAAGYKADLQAYVERYKFVAIKRKVNMITWSNAYSVIMYAMPREIPGIDLKTLTREQIYAQDLPCISVARAVEAGWLPQVDGWESLIAQL